jgi:hypothetical protein
VASLLQRNERLCNRLQVLRQRRSAKKRRHCRRLCSQSEEPLASLGHLTVLEHAHQRRAEGAVPVREKGGSRG